MLLLVWLLPVSGIILRFIGDVCISSSLLYVAEEDSITEVCHDWFTFSPAGGYWAVASLWLFQ